MTTKKRQPDAFGDFCALIEAHLGDLGEWRFFRVSRESNDAFRASLKGRGGRVEVWDGVLHRREVWAVQGRQETCTGTGCHGTELREAVERACAIVGVQTRMEAMA